MITDNPRPITDLHNQVFASFAEAFQHAQEEMCGLHQVFEVSKRLLGFIVFSQQGQEDFPELHHVENVTWMKNDRMESKYL